MKTNLDTDAQVTGVANMATDPSQNGLNCVLIPGLQSISEGASMAKSQEKIENVKWRMVGALVVKDQV
jgi:hypothetical protein